MKGRLLPAGCKPPASRVCYRIFIFNSILKLFSTALAARRHATHSEKVGTATPPSSNPCPDGQRDDATHILFLRANLFFRLRQQYHSRSTSSVRTHRIHHVTTASAQHLSMRAGVSSSAYSLPRTLNENFVIRPSIHSCTRPPARTPPARQSLHP